MWEIRSQPNSNQTDKIQPDSVRNKLNPLNKI